MTMMVIYYDSDGMMTVMATVMLIAVSRHVIALESIGSMTKSGDGDQKC